MSKVKTVLSATILLLPLIFNINCKNYICDNSGCYEKRSNHDQLVDIYTYYSLFKLAGDYYDRLYYVNQAIIADETNKNSIYEVTTDPNPAKFKVVMVHGWMTKDRSDKVLTYPSLNELKDRILTENWSDFMSQIDSFDKLLIDEGIEFYAYDYLTSDPIDTNGKRFRQKLDALFTGQTDKVIIYANSMGGLVSRFAVYEDPTTKPDYLAAVISTGTPYHGSPWASPQYQSTLPAILSEVGAFLTDTEGGSDLRWDNFDNALAGASNPKLTQLNSLTTHDNLFHAFYGAYDKDTLPGVPTGLSAVCGIMNVFDPTVPSFPFNPSDCIVPATSAFLSDAGGVTKFTGQVQSFADHDHIDLKMGTATVRAAFILKVCSIFNITGTANCP